METVQAVIHLPTEGTKTGKDITLRVEVDILEMIYTIIKPWIAELLYMGITEAQPSVHHPQKHLYKKELYYQSHLYLLNQVTPSPLLIQIHHYYHPLFIPLLGGIKTSLLLDHLIHLLEVIQILIGQEIRAINQIVQ